MALKYGFQSSLPRGERRILIRIPYWIGLFQSSLPRGERRHLPSRSWSSRIYFNPRSREGSDLARRIGDILSLNFNPRSREGSDADRVIGYRSNGISILAPARGATAILAKSLPIFSAKINKLFFLYSPLLFFPLPFLL